MPIKGQGQLFDVIRCKDNDEWLATRKLGVGGSDVAALVGLSPWTSPAALYLEKTGNPLPDTLSDSGIVQFGNDFEKVVLEKFAKDHPTMRVRRVNAILRSKKRPWAQASLDGEVCEDGEWGILEIKCPGSVAKWNEGVPAHYLAQANHYMHITGRTFCWFAAFFRDTCEYRWVRVDYDPGFAQTLEDAADDFWLNCVQQSQPPTKTFGAPDEAQALLKLYDKPSSNFLHAEDDTSVADVVDAWQKAKADEEAAAKEKRRLANYLMQLIGDNRGIIIDGAKITWRRGTSSILDKRKLELLYPGAIAQCSETKPKNMGLYFKATT